ncbi:hypothetical protein [Dyella sp. 20L07]|uniref:hypothetical protein n=1 Tax=Dyella sp. 20L07 TaxID=3384240 RepID=UPI003D2684BE
MIHRVVAWIGLIMLLMVHVRALAATACDGRPFGQVDKPLTVAKGGDAGKSFSVGAHEIAPQPLHGIATTSWGWGCSTTVIADFDRAKVARIFRCLPGSSDYQALWKRYAQRADLVTRRTTDKIPEQLEAVEIRALTPAQMNELACAANRVWSEPPPIVDPDDRAARTPVPPHSVSYMRLWDGPDEKFVGGFSFPGPEATAVMSTLYELFPR